ncbi:MAG: hypothetical protein NTY01_12275 [Verrucomicrobia bacterium]|nr:hypothetical protein [Verrucomicrobiota bacterium]
MVLEKFRAAAMVDVHLPTMYGRRVILSRYSQPEKERAMQRRMRVVAIEEDDFIQQTNRNVGRAAFTVVEESKRYQIEIV